MIKHFDKILLNNCISSVCVCVAQAPARLSTSTPTFEATAQFRAFMLYCNMSVYSRILGTACVCV